MCARAPPHERGCVALPIHAPGEAELLQLSALNWNWMCDVRCGGCAMPSVQAYEHCRHQAGCCLQQPDSRACSNPKADASLTHHNATPHAHGMSFGMHRAHGPTRDLVFDATPNTAKIELQNERQMNDCTQGLSLFHIVRPGGGAHVALGRRWGGSVDGRRSPALTRALVRCIASTNSSRESSPSASTSERVQM